MTRKSSPKTRAPFAGKELAGHPLVKKVLENLRPLLDTASRELEALAQKGKVRDTSEQQLWEYEWYDDDVFRNVAAITSAIENLERSRKFIQAFPQPRTYERKGVSQHTWIEYHHSHYVITLVSVFDVALILTNSVFRLGNRERDCRRDLIIKNSWVARTPVAAVLDELAQLIRPYREGRNMHVHHGRVPKIAAAMKSETLDRLDVFSFVQMCGKPVVERRLLELAYKGQVKQICKRLQEETDNIHEVLWRLFDRLAPIYEENATSLHTKWRKILEKELERRKKLKAQTGVADR